MRHVLKERGLKARKARPFKKDHIRKIAKGHVHIFLSYRPNQEVSKIVQWLKGISSRVLLQEFSHFKEEILVASFLGEGLFSRP